MRRSRSCSASPPAAPASASARRNTSPSASSAASGWSSSIVGHAPEGCEAAPGGRARPVPGAVEPGRPITPPAPTPATAAGSAHAGSAGPPRRGRWRRRRGSACGRSAGRRRRRARIGPDAEAGLGQAAPGEQRARIDLAPGGEIGVADDVRARDALAAVVVEFDADRGGVEVADLAPAAGAGMPGAVGVGDELVDAAVGADQVVRADPPAAVARAQGVQAALGRVLLGVVGSGAPTGARPGSGRCSCRSTGCSRCPTPGR